MSRRQGTERDAISTMLPLTPAVFHILLSLAEDTRHGYGVIVDVRERTDGEIRLGTGTLYTAIKRLLDQGLVEETAASAGGDSRRQSAYRTTDLGRALLSAETERLRSMVEMAGTVLPSGSDTGAR